MLNLRFKKVNSTFSARALEYGLFLTDSCWYTSSETVGQNLQDLRAAVNRIREAGAMPDFLIGAAAVYLLDGCTITIVDDGSLTLISDDMKMLSEILTTPVERTIIRQFYSTTFRGLNFPISIN